MLSRLHSALTYANVMATVAVFVALGGGAYAALKLPANSVGSKQIRKHAVTPSKVAPATIALFKGQKGDQGPMGDTGAPGAQGVPGIQGPAGPSNAYFGHGGNGATADASATVSVPAGDYAVHGEALMDTSTTASQGGCFLKVNNNTLSANASNGGNVVHFDTSTAADGQASDEGVAHLAAAGSITNECTVTSGGGVVGNVAILAIQVGSASP